MSQKLAEQIRFHRNEYLYGDIARMGKSLWNKWYVTLYRDIYASLELEIYYIMRCLNKVNQPFEKDKLITILQDNIYCVIYPYNDERNINKINPMFCLGIKMTPPSYEIQTDKRFYINIEEINSIQDIIEYNWCKNDIRHFDK